MQMNKKNIAIISLVVLLVACLAWGYSQYKEKSDYYAFIDNNTARSYYGIIEGVDTISTELSKLMVSSQGPDALSNFTKIWATAQNVNDMLASMPFQHAEFTKTSKFLGQLSDYTYAMAQKVVGGDALSENDIATLATLYEYSRDLTTGLYSLDRELIGGEGWKKRFRSGFDGSIAASQEMDPFEANLISFEEGLSSYPEMVYDGPFSDHVILGSVPKLGGDPISEEEAKRIVDQFIRGNTADERMGDINEIIAITGIGQVPNQNTDTENQYKIIETYSFKVTFDGVDEAVYMDVTKNGGHPLYIMSAATIEQANISRKQAEKIADTFIAQRGITSVEKTFSQRNGNAVVVNYAAVQDGVILYSDLVKVTVSLAGGEIIGYDASNYIYNHHKRSIPEAAVSAEEAREKINLSVTVNSAPRLCYIPTEFNKELFCWEFSAESFGEHFLIYINAQTGREEKVLKLLIDSTGTLAV